MLLLLYGESSVGSTGALIQDPCPLRLPEILTVAHMTPILSSSASLGQLREWSYQIRRSYTISQCVVTCRLFYYIYIYT